jgi:5-carboxyvanillate decarboxylase
MATDSSPSPAVPSSGAYRRIATEEAFITGDIEREVHKIVENHSLDDPGFYSLMGHYMTSESERARFIVSRLRDLGELRLADMDAAGIAVQLLLLTAPGVQAFERGAAVSLARSANDELAEAVRRHPDRLAGLAAIAPQDPPKAAEELERAVTSLGLKGAVVNSHTQGEYLDDPRYTPIFEAATSLQVPIYLHPQTPPKSMIGPFLDRGIDGAIYGFAIETSVHMLRMIIGGVFDRFPSLQFVVGHLGEGLPFWLYRLDYMHNAIVRANRYEGVKPLQRKLSDYLRENFSITTSGMPWEPAIMFTRSVIGADRVMYAMDYPYQYSLDEVKLSDALPLSVEELRDFYEGIATRVFKL